MKSSRILVLATALLIAGASQAGGLLSRLKGNSQPKQDAAAQQQMPQNMDCNQMASMPNSPMTVEQCRSMMGMAQSGQTAMNDPSGARPGDANMSCADIQAEMSHMSGVGVSEPHRQQGAKAASELQAENAKQQREIAGIAARQQVELNAAIAADQATEAASGGLAHGRAAVTLQQQQLAENKVTGERMAKEAAPKQQAVMGAVTAGGGDMVSSMQSNPRFGRLIQLAGEKGCH
jgi:hypothetical protein